jgi:HEAT repeat protein
MPTTTRLAAVPHCAAVAAAALVAVIGGTPGLARGDDLDSVMYSAPEIRVARTVKTHSAKLAEAWAAALERPERDVRVGAALAIARAHEDGAAGLTAAIPALLRVLDRPDEHPAVRAAAVRALVALDARAAAPAFLALAAGDDPDLCDAVESALARWDHTPARALWLARLEPSVVSRAGVRAIRCLGAVREERAAGRLRELVMAAETAPAVRLAAAAALGEIRRSGSEADALKLGADLTPAGRTGRLAAASLLRRHEGAEAVRALQTLAADPEPAVAAIATTRLSELGTRHLLPVLAAVMGSEGAEVRGRGVAAMIDNPSADSLLLLRRALSDPHPDVRGAARRGLRALAADRRGAVIGHAADALGGAEWRAQEQAAILLAQLDHKPAAPRLVALLTTERSEVAVAVGWALRTLAVADTLPAARARVAEVHAGLLKPVPARPRGVTPAALDRQLAHLVQFMGQAGYAAADADLRKLVPRILRPGMPPVFTPVGAETRAAAVWALGLFHEQKADAGVIDLILGRLQGDGLFGPDDQRVRRMAAVSLGRLRAAGAKKLLADFTPGPEPSTDVVTNACRWALARQAGQPAPDPGVIELPQRDWFLTPVVADK